MIKELTISQEKELIRSLSKMIDKLPNPPFSAPYAVYPKNIIEYFKKYIYIPVSKGSEMRIEPIILHEFLTYFIKSSFAVKRGAQKEYPVNVYNTIDMCAPMGVFKSIFCAGINIWRADQHRNQRQLIMGGTSTVSKSLFDIILLMLGHNMTKEENPAKEYFDQRGWAMEAGQVKGTRQIRFLRSGSIIVHGPCNIATAKSGSGWNLVTLEEAGDAKDREAMDAQETAISKTRAMSNPIVLRATNWPNPNNQMMNTAIDTSSMIQLDEYFFEEGKRFLFFASSRGSRRNIDDLVNMYSKIAPHMTRERIQAVIDSGITERMFSHWYLNNGYADTSKMFEDNLIDLCVDPELPKYVSLEYFEKNLMKRTNSDIVIGIGFDGATKKKGADRTVLSVMAKYIAKQELYPDENYTVFERVQIGLWAWGGTGDLNFKTLNQMNVVDKMAMVVKDYEENKDFIIRILFEDAFCDGVITAANMSNNYFNIKTIRPSKANQREAVSGMENDLGEPGRYTFSPEHWLLTEEMKLIRWTDEVDAMPVGGTGLESNKKGVNPKIKYVNGVETSLKDDAFKATMWAEMACDSVNLIPFESYTKSSGVSGASY